MSLGLDSTWSPPASFDGFALRGLIGEGGMGRVYLAHEEMLDRHVAIKFILAEVIEGAARERFLTEARAVARLSHANIVAVHRIGEVQGRPYVAYEYVDGASLEEHPRPASWADVLRIGVGVSRALSAAHARGVLHRDIKPANVLQTASGELKLVDFGLAKLHADAPDVTATSVAPASELPHDVTQPLQVPAGMLAARRTATGMLVGTPLYVAPEVWLGNPASPASDVFGLGVLLYELATGAIPHAGRSVTEIAQAAVSSGLPSIGQIRPDFPLALSKIIERAVERSPEARFVSGVELLEALESLDQVLSGFRTLAPPKTESVDGATLVAASLGRLGAHVDEVYRSVYALLFEKAPALRPLFPEDLSQQRAKLAAALQLIVQNLRCPEHIVTTLEELGERHVGYGAREEHLATLGEALLAALELHDPMPWDELTRRAWQDAYAAIGLAMRRGLSSGTLTRPDLAPLQPAKVS
jgi:eukaryotic-like serine/threonine-protein kinase